MCGRIAGGQAPETQDCIGVGRQSVNIVAADGEAELTGMISAGRGWRKSSDLAPRVDIPEDQVAELAACQCPVTIG